MSQWARNRHFEAEKELSVSYNVILSDIIQPLHN